MTEELSFMQRSFRINGEIKQLLKG
jgi:hypothetical protein